MKTKTIALSIFAALNLAVPLSADQQAIPLGATPSAAQIGHIFVNTCEPALPPLMEKKFALYETAFGWSAAQAGTDAAFAPAQGGVLVTFDANWEGATCELSVPAAISGDGAAIYDGLIAHLEAEIDALPSPNAIDGGLKWEWKRAGTAIDVTYTVEFIETSEGHILRTQAKQF
ncbi:MAG: hypothetical protein AAF393_02665 [Pseudomonadota bacterium]